MTKWQRILPFSLFFTGVCIGVFTNLSWIPLFSILAGFTIMAIWWIRRKKKNDLKLAKLLATLIEHIEKHGSRSSQVKQFVQDNKDVDEFVDLAATTIFAYEYKAREVK